MFLRSLIIFLLLFPISENCISQVQTDFRDSDSIVVIPGGKYQAGTIHRMIFGDTWRDLWNTPIKVPILDLAKFAGGLTPIKRGGGQQTLSLRMQGKNGKLYKFRASMKSTKKILPQELLNTFVEDVLSEIFSTSNPMSAIIVTPIINAVGVLQAQPSLVYIEDSELLGNYREEFGGLLGTLEEHPDDSQERNFADADKIFATYKLFNKMLKDNDYQVDEPEFLKARLLDIFLGDWDRHYDQWRWAAYNVDEKKICKPIPRDRDQALCRYDGILPWIITLSIPQISHCGKEYNDINDLTWSGRYLDRKFLSSIDKHTWDSVAAYVNSRITDSLINYSVSLLPEEIYKNEGEDLRDLLFSRREKFLDVSDDYYKEMAKYVDIRMSNKREYAIINRLDDSEVEIIIHKIDDAFLEKKGTVLFHRIFRDKHTAEIRLYLFGGDDVVVVSGKGKADIDIHIIGGEGRDKFYDDSKVKGPLFGFLPFLKQYDIKNYFYDDGNKSKFKVGSSAYIDENKFPESKNDTMKFEPKVRDWGHNWVPSVWFSANSDDGLFIGGGPILYEYGFRNDPYNFFMSLNAGYSFLLNGYRAEFDSDFPIKYSRNKISFNLYATSIDVVNFFGFGNETKLDKKYKIDEDYNRVYFSFLSAKLSKQWFISKNSNFELGLNANLVNLDIEDGTYIDLNRPDSTTNMLFYTIKSNFNFDSRDMSATPTKGVFINFSADYTPDLAGNKEHFGRVKADARSYLSFKFITDITFALRVSGEKIWGKYPFFESAFLGGSKTIRAYDKQRFAGDASLFSNLEMRFFLGNTRILVPGKIGLLAMADAGRVFFKDEVSENIHYAIGGGIWMSFVEPQYLISVYIAKSPENLAFYIQSGFAF